MHKSHLDYCRINFAGMEGLRRWQPLLARNHAGGAVSSSHPVSSAAEVHRVTVKSRVSRGTFGIRTKS
jgi:hypothetical protein